MHQRLRLAALLVVAAACGGAATVTPQPNPPPPTPPAAVNGIAMPTELSALPPKAAAAHGLRAALARVVAPADSDYATAPSEKFVDERALDQFDIFNTIFGALAQTNYADAENVNAGPYRALVAWKEGRSGDAKNGKQLEDWVVDSSMVKVGGADVNVVHVWMIQPPHEVGMQPTHIQIEFRISQAPTRRADGTYADYGVWTIQAQSDETPPMAFAASATRDASGVSTIQVHQQEQRGETKGVLQRADASGFGKVSFPNETWTNNQRSVVQTEVAYAYDAGAVALSIAGAAPIYKSRTQVVDVVNRRALYDATTFADVARHHSFGFSVAFTGADGFTHYGYYGAWQGRHSLWLDGQQGLPAGATVSRSDRDPALPPLTYTASPVFTGVLVKRTPVASSLAEIKDVVLQGMDQRNLNLTKTAPDAWTACVNPHWDPGQQQQACDSSGPFADFASLVKTPGDARRWVNINTWDQVAMRPVQLAWQDGAFYEVDPAGNPTATVHVVNVGDQLWVNINGPLFLAYDGAAWQRKAVAAWPQNQPMPTFLAGGDVLYAGFELGREYYLNDRGTNYIVTRTGAAAFDVKIERQVAANPLNAPGFLPAGTVLRRQWDLSKASDFTSFRFDVDPASATYMQLVCATVSSADQASGRAVGQVVTTGEWGLASASVADQFNWEYPQGGDGWGRQQFLLAADGSYLLLDDPIRLQPVALTSATGVTKTYTLQFDGSWVSGLPDIWNDLSANGYQMSAAIAEEVVEIPDGLVVTDGTSSYVFKALSTNELLMPIDPVAGLVLGGAQALDLGQVPAFVEPVLGARPAVAIKYSEGKAVK